MSFGFQAPEHRGIGDRVVLRFPDGNISGAEFKYAGGAGFPDKMTLSFGQIIALAGDFYGNCKRLGDAEQISDKWYSDPEASIQRFLSNTDLLNKNTKGYLHAVVKIMEKQEADIREVIHKGQDVAQAFKLHGDEYDRDWAFATKSDYIFLTLCNWDHFGQDAVSAYTAGHTAALRQAKVAHEKNDMAMLRYAYFLEAFACPGVNDGEDVESGGLVALSNPLWKADQCARYMHDEDCANGLWVTRARGKASWPAYGDSQLFSPQGYIDFDAALDAAQTGANEVWKVFESGTGDDFKVLKMIPILGDMSPPNYSPLFKSDNSNLYLRANIDNRFLETYDVYPLSNVPWKQILQRILSSGQSKNQLPQTLELLCPSRLLHLRAIDELNLSVAQYGAVVSQSPTKRNASVESWNMQSQAMLSIPQSSGQTTWNSAQRIDSGTYSLVGRALQPSKTQTTYHVGLKKTDKDVEVLWADEVPDGNSVWEAGNVWYGRFDADKEDLAMIKHWFKGESPWKSKLELWTFSTGTQEAPTRKKTEWPSNFTLPPYTAFGIRMDTKDVSDTFVTAALDESVSSNKTLWTFSTWNKGYTNLVYSTCYENLSERAQKTFVKGGATKTAANRVIRLFYGEKYSMRGYIRIDVLQLSTSSIATISTSQFRVTWPSTKEEHYLTWFFSDVAADGNLDLVGLVTSDDGSLTVLAFKPKSDESAGFEDPVVSRITSDKGSMLTAPFMKPILAQQALYKFPDTTSEVDSGIMMAFDNFGILGVRLLRPKSYGGTLQYEIDGQVPAIAGQVSTTLGCASRLFQTAKEPVGLFVEY